jgi:hypothetical protein
MVAWSEVVSAAPELAATAQRLFDAHAHKTIATLRKDGSPRISGTEAKFAEGELWFGAMWRSRKALDLRRDPRFALHSASIDPDEWEADAKVAGRVVEIEDPARKAALVAAGRGDAPSGEWHLFLARVEELVVVRLGDPPDHLVIELWREGEGVRQMERR